MAEEQLLRQIKALERRVEEAGRFGPPRVYRSTVSTTDATVTTIYTFGTATNVAYSIWIDVVAHRTGGSAGTANDSGIYTRRCAVKNDSGTVTILATDTIGTDREDQAGWDVTLSVISTNVLCQVKGALNNNVSWSMRATVEQV